MKRVLLLALTLLMLCAVLTACGTTAYVNDPYHRGYSNVSTTHDGTVNGVNGYGYSYPGAYYGGYGNGAMTGYANGNDVVGNGTSSTTVTGTNRSSVGTGMAGER